MASAAQHVPFAISALPLASLGLRQQFDKLGPSIPASPHHPSLEEPAPPKPGRGVPSDQLGLDWSLSKTARFSDPQVLPRKSTDLGGPSKEIVHFA